MIKEIIKKEEKMNIADAILRSLPDWFGIEDALNEYVKSSANEIMFASFIDDKPIGFLCLKETSKATVELSVMGILMEYHRQGIGKDLFKEAKNKAKDLGYSFMQVKTVKMGLYDSYDKTNLFYQSLGFKELEVFPTLWDEWNPCLIYIMAL